MKENTLRNVSLSVVLLSGVLSKDVGPSIYLL